MSAEIINGGRFEKGAIEEARRVLDEIDQNLKRTQGSNGVMVTDQQTERVLRVLRILTNQVDFLIQDAAGDDDTSGFGGGGADEGPFVDNNGREL